MPITTVPTVKRARSRRAIGPRFGDARPADGLRGHASPLLTDKVVLVTGAPGRVATAIAEEAAAAGASIALLGAGQSGEPMASPRRAGRLMIAGEVAESADAEEAVAATVAAFGRVDVLVNTGTAQRIGEDSATRRLAASVKFAHLMSKAAARPMLEGGEGGVILNVGLDLTPGERQTDATYPGTHTTVLRLTRTLAIELAPYGIRVVMISQRSSNDEPAERRTRLDDDTIGDREDEDLRKLTTAAVFLASDSANTVTGCNWPISRR